MATCRGDGESLRDSYNFTELLHPNSASCHLNEKQTRETRRENYEVYLTVQMRERKPYTNVQSRKEICGDASDAIPLRDDV